MQDNPPTNLSPNLPPTRRTTVTTEPFAGFAAESAKEGETLRVLSKCIVTADNPRFYMFVNQISDDFLARASIDGDSITKFLVVQQPNGEADVYTEYPVIVRARVTRDVTAGEPLYPGDINISTIERYHPASLTLQPGDVFICVMKVGWNTAYSSMPAAKL